MSFKVGDVSFGRNGEPAVVVNRDAAKGELTLSKDQKQIEKYHKHGYINGLKSEDRASLQSLLDDVSAAKDPEEKVSMLKEKITEIESDPRQFQLLNYLKSELFHVMHLNNISPKEYKLQQFS